MAHEPDHKRSKTDTLLEDVVNEDIFKREAEFTAKYAAAQPYPHAILPNLFRPSFLQAVIGEIKDHSKVHFKESDLFRVYQSIDLANLTADCVDQMPSVWQLRNVLYSDRWRSMMERLAGLPANTLTNQVDCACNCHATGCHLLCHDDVIGTRKLSYILYLTDDSWQAQEGGALELYAADKDQLPATMPSASALPLANHMAFFEVRPGVSFHAVAEVVGDRPRLSLQGWYHAATPPSAMESATLQRLKTMRDKEDSFEPMNCNATTFSDTDREYLAKYLDATYLQPQAMADMKARFEEDSSIQLRHFLTGDWVGRLRTATTRADDKVLPANVTDPDFYHHGMEDDWQLVGPSHMQRYLEYQAKPVDKPSTAGQLLAILRYQLLQSPAFGRYLASITSLESPIGYRGPIRRFRPGRDYTVAHYGILTQKSVLDATLCFVAGDGQQIDPESENVEETADLVWQSGDCGGFECYIAADDDENDQAADEYHQDDDTELLSVSASNNTLSLVYRDPGTMRFVKYLSAKAPSSRWDIAMEYQVQDDVEEDGDEEEQQE